MRKVMHMRGQHRREFVSARKHRELLAVFNEGVVGGPAPECVGLEGAPCGTKRQGEAVCE